MDDVALQAGVGKGTLYLYFADKEDLIFQAAVTGFDEMCAGLPRCAAENGAFRDRLLATCGHIVTFFQARRPLFRIILSEGERLMEAGGTGLRQRWRKRRRSLTEAVAAILGEGVTAQEVRADIPTAILAEYLLGMLRTRSWEMEDRPEAQRSHATVVDLFLTGAGRPKSSAPS